MEEDWLANPELIEPSLEENLLPIEDVEGLDTRIVDTLRTSGFSNLFPVQRAVFQKLASGPPRDLLVAASTGSGKTLAYSLPLVNCLSKRLVVRLRALIVVPGRELAQQVGAVLSPFCSAVGLSMAVVVGQTSMVAEQKKLVSIDRTRHCSNVDILVATPGRLVDHLQQTSGFTLQHLEWLIIDEADRLLDQNFQDWLPKVLDATVSSMDKIEPGFEVTLREGQAPFDSLCGLSCWATPLRKMLFSATLSQNPAKLAQLHLNKPMFLSVSADSSKYAVPEGLEEFMHVVEEGEKVHALIHLLESCSVSRAICFTKSVEAAEKLARLLQVAMPEQSNRIRAFTSELLGGGARQELLALFNTGQIDVLVCSDGAARGLDLEAVGAVINYDIPVHVKTYIHRVGRTARAGVKGVAYSLLEAREAHHFKLMLSKGRSSKAPIQKLKIKPEEIEPIRSAVNAAVETLQSDQLIQAVAQQFSYS